LRSEGFTLGSIAQKPTAALKGQTSLPQSPNFTETWLVRACTWGALAGRKRAASIPFRGCLPSATMEKAFQAEMSGFQTGCCRGGTRNGWGHSGKRMGDGGVPWQGENDGADCVPRVLPSATMVAAFQAGMSGLQTGCCRGGTRNGWGHSAKRMGDGGVPLQGEKG